MPNENQDHLYEQFVAVAGDFVEISGGITGLLGDLAGKSPDAIATVSSPALSSTFVPPAVPGVPIPAATTSGTSAAPVASGGGSVLDTLGSAAKSVAENALGALPLIRGIVSLFGGGDDSPAPPKLTKYLLPPSLQFDAADTPSGIRNVDYNQTSAPRAFGAPDSSSQAPAPSAPITVNIQAMDARSFLDRSSDIAAAVREAMLNSSALNDVVSEL